MFQNAFLSIPFYVVGSLQGMAAATVLLLSVGAIAIRRRRRAFTASLEALGWIVPVTGTLYSLAFLAELLVLLLANDPYERMMWRHQFAGIYSLMYWMTCLTAAWAPQLLWFRRARTNPYCAGAISSLIVLPGRIEGLIALVTPHAETLQTLSK